MGDLGYDTLERNSDFFTRDLDTGIRDFQRDRGLRIDGFMNPGGKTERAIFESRTNRRADEVFGSADPEASRQIGFGGNVSGVMARKAYEARQEQSQPIFQRVQYDARKETNPSAFEEETRPAQYDATGRMIRSWNQPPVPGRKPEATQLPVPKQKPSILKNADDSETFDFIQKHELLIDHLYKDNKGYITIGAGHRVPSMEEAKKLPFYVHENGKPARIATDKEIENIFDQVKSIPHGQTVRHTTYNPANHENMPDIRLKKEDAASLLKRDLHVRAQELQNSWEGFDELPGNLQKAMLDVHFNTGNFRPSNWKGFKAAFDNEDYESMAREISRKTENKDRNKAVQDLINSIRKKQK